MSYEFTGTALNAVKSTVGQMGDFIGGVAEKARSLVAGWITGNGPLARLWSGICDAFDSVIVKFKSAVEEKPLIVLAVGAAVVVVIVMAVVFLGPGMISKFLGGCVKAIGDMIASVIQALKNAISGIFRRG